VNEIVIGVNIALGTTALDACPVSVGEPYVSPDEKQV
jgi:hypothetical protein